MHYNKSDQLCCTLQCTRTGTYLRTVKTETLRIFTLKCRSFCITMVDYLKYFFSPQSYNIEFLPSYRVDPFMDDNELSASLLSCTVLPYYFMILNLRQFSKSPSCTVFHLRHHNQRLLFCESNIGWLPPPPSIPPPPSSFLACFRNKSLSRDIYSYVRV